MPIKPVIPRWRRLIDTSKVMSIAVGSNGTAWSAPVYYLFDGKGFYFFSNPESRHIKRLKNGQAAASIFRDDKEMRKLQGIQMSGTIFKSALNAASIRVAKKYCAHFNITHNTKDILGFFASKFHARLYNFKPETMYYMDNSKGFGEREKVVL